MRPPRHRTTVHPAGGSRWAGALAALAALPVVVATGRALVRGWLPMGDNAYFSIRARDVLTQHHPLVGAWSSGSEVVGFDVNNLGPLQLDLLALPVKVSWAAGTAVGVAAINIVAIVLAVLVADRLAGRPAAGCLAAAAAGVSWTMGSELLFEPRQHHALLLPFLCFLVLVWALVAARRWALPLAVGVGSLLVQTHLSYVLLVVLLGAVGVSGLALAAWRDQEVRRGIGRSVAAAGAVVAVCWVQPVVEQVTADDRGNLAAVLAASEEHQEAPGAAHGVRALATVVAVPPWWAPSTFAGFDPQHGLASAGRAAAGLVAVAALLTGAGFASARSGRREVAAAVMVAAGAVVAGWASAARQPSGGVFGLVAGNYRWLWPIAAFVTFVLVLAVLARIPRGSFVAGGAAVVLTAVALVPSHRVPVTRQDEALMPVARELLARLDGARVEEPVAVARGELFFGEPYTYVLLAGLQDRGVDFDVVGARDLRRFGDGRRPQPGTAVLTLVSGDEAVAVPEGWERVGFATGFDDDEREELERLRHDRSSGPRRQHLEERWRRETVAAVLRRRG